MKSLSQVAYGLLGAVLCAALLAADAAQAQERRGRNRPILRLKSNFPIGTVRQLAFTQEEGRYTLYSAGDDKVVRRWTLDAENGKLEPARQYHWPIYLAERGTIHALSVTRHPTAGELIAVGGIGYTPPLVALIPRDDPDGLLTLLDGRNNGEFIVQQPVRSLDFWSSPQIGISRLAVGEFQRASKPADVLVWDVSNPGSPNVTRLATQLRAADLVAINPSGTRVAAAGLNFANDGSSVEVWDIATAKRLSLVKRQIARDGSFFRGGLAWTSDDSWVCGSLIGPFPSNFPESREIFGRSHIVTRDREAGVQGIEVVNSSRRPVTLDLWRDLNRRTPHERNVALAPGQKQVLSEDLDGVGVDVLVQGSSEYDKVLGVPKGGRLEFVEEHDVAALALVPGSPRELVVALREGDRVRVCRQAIGGEPALLDSSAVFDAPQHEPVALAVSPDGRYVAAAGRGQVAGEFPCWQIRVWEYATGAPLAETPPRDAKELPISGPIEEVAVKADDHTTVHFRRGTVWKSVPLAGRILGSSDEKPVSAEKNVLITHSEAPHMDKTTVLGQIPAGTSLTSIETQDGWHKVAWKEADGWVHSSKVVPAASVVRSAMKLERMPGKTFLVTACNAAVMSGTRTLARIPAGTTIVSRETRPGWHSVLFQQHSGWVSAGEVTPMFERGFCCVDDPSARTPPVPHPAHLRPNCAARVTWPAGGEALDLLAVGYDDGILVWDLTAKPPRAVRSFYTHESPVTCLDFSVDGRLLVTGAADGTISGWRVDGWKEGNDLGVTLEGKRVARVVEPSPGWEAGFTVGQVVSGVNRDGIDLDESEWRSALGSALPGKRLMVRVEKHEYPLATPVSWDPLWSYAPRYDGDWVLWTPQGHLETKATLRGNLGAELPLEWQVGLLRNSVAPGGKTTQLPAAPRLFDAGVFLRLNAERTTGSDGRRTMGQILDAAVTSVTPAPDDCPQFPDVDLRLDPGNGRPRVTRLEITPPTGQVVAEVQLWLNTLRIDDARVERLRGGTPLDLAQLSAFRAGENHVVAVTTLRDADDRTGKSRHFFQDVRRFTLPTSPTAVEAARIHYVGCGVSDAKRKEFAILNYAGTDVLDVAGALRQTIPAKRLGTLSVLANGVPEEANVVAPTAKGLLDALAKLAREAQPEDLALVMLAGHGIEGTGGSFRFIAEDGVVPAEKMLAALSRLRCRTVLILDTCHSEGVAGIDQQLQEFSRLLPGPLIITSCARKEESQDHAALKNGVFTAALKEALTGQAPLADLSPARQTGPLTVGSLFEFIERRMPEYKEKLSGLRGQTPQRIDSLGFADADRYRLD